MVMELRKELEKKIQYRSIEEPKIVVDEEKRTAEFSFSSESEVSRWGFIEKLSHRGDAVDLKRLSVAGPLLLDHTARDQIGKVERCWLDQETKKCRAVVRFSRNQRADEVFQDVKDGIRESVSVGYMIHDLELEGKRENENVYLVTRWEPLEISFTAIPADIQVGMGRSITEEGRAKMPEVHEDSGKRIQEILAIGDHFSCQDEAKRALIEGKSIEEFRAQVMAKIAPKPNTSVASQLGMQPREVQNFSICRALAATMTGDWSNAGYEQEVSNAIAKKRGENIDQGFYIPTEMLMRSAEVTSQTAGGFIAPDYRPDAFIEMLSARSIIRRLGAQMLTDLKGPVAIPRQTQTGDAYWIEEEGEPEQAKIKIDQLSMTPRTLSAFYDITRRTVLQSSFAVENFIRNELATILAQKIDTTILHGSESKKGFLGLLNQPELQAVIADPKLNFSHICDLEHLISSKDADLSTMAFLVNSTGRYLLRQTKEQEHSTTGLWDAGNGTQPTDTGSVLGFPAFVSNILKTGDYKGTPNMIPIILGVWKKIMIGEWGVMSVKTDPYSLSKSGGLRIVVHYDLDLLIRHIESFAVVFVQRK